MSETFNTDPVRFLKNGRINIGGKIYYGVVNGDPVNVSNDRIDIFANRDLTTALPNPISTGADGRTAVNGVPAKVWLGARHSLFELDNKNVEQFQDLDRGETPGTGAPIRLTNVQGTNAITAEAPGGITGYVDSQIYIFGKADGANTATTAPWVTLAITGASQGVKPIRFNFNEEIKAGMFQETQEIQLMYNSAGAPTTDHFTLVNAGRGISVLTDIAGTADIITAKGGPSKVGYVNGQHYQFKPSGNNTTSVTLNIETIGAKPIKSGGIELVPGQLIANKNAEVIYNVTGDEFELASGAGTAVAPASATDGNVVKFGALPTQLVDSLVSSLGPLSIQSFTTVGTWNRPSNVKSVLIIATASGGGGAGSDASNAGSGGGAGATSIKFIAAAAASYVISIGTAGPAGASGGGAGGGGGNVTVGTAVVVATGGGGAFANQTGGLGGTINSGVGDFKIPGARGHDVFGGSNVAGAAGGGSFWGGGGAVTRSGTGDSTGSYGSGGGGAASIGNLGGGQGEPGAVFFLEFG